MIMHSFFIIFLLLDVCLEISLVNSQHKNTTKITTTSSKITTKGSTQTTTLSKPAYCNYTECQPKGGKSCLCPEFNDRNHSFNWPVPKKDTCPSIGCSLSSKNCYCGGSSCECSENKCNKTECAERSLFSGCYCYIENKAIKTYYMPASKKCSDLLKEIGHHDGRYQCSEFSCKCDEYGDCVCKQPKNKNPQIPKPKECNSGHCERNSFEFCECTYFYCANDTCTSDVVFKKLPKTGVCSGILKFPYQCTNVGQKCRCKTDCVGTTTQYEGNSPKKSECICNDVDEQISNDPCNNCESFGSCICTYGELAVRIGTPNSPKNCTTLEMAKTPNTTKFDACPYHEGQLCECKQNPNTGKKRCFCEGTSKRIPPFSLRPHPYACCNDDSDCIEHSELYCYCTNYANNTYVKKVSHSHLTKQEFDDKLCYVYGHPPDFSCHIFGYVANCVHGFCKLKQINLYYSDIF